MLQQWYQTDRNNEFSGLGSKLPPFLQKADNLRSTSCQFLAVFSSHLKDGRFEILRLPPGRYRLMFLPTVGDRPAGPEVYYPGTQAHSAAALIEVDEGAHVEGLLFTTF